MKLAVASVAFLTGLGLAGLQPAAAGDGGLVGGLVGAGAGAAIGGAVGGSAGAAVAGGIIGGATGAIIGSRGARHGRYWAYDRGCYVRVGHHRYRRVSWRYCD